MNRKALGVLAGATAVLALIIAAAVWFFGIRQPKASQTLTTVPSSNSISFTSLAPREAQALISEKKVKVLDIRTPEEIATERIVPNADYALDYYASDFAEKLADLSKEEAYLLLCRSGNRSGSALNTMRSMGFVNARDVRGGLLAWKAEGLETYR